MANLADERFVKRMLDALLQPRGIGAYLYTMVLLSAVGYALEPLAVLADYEEIIDKYIVDFEESPVLPEQKRDALKMTLPQEIEKAFNLNMLGREEETKFEDYDTLKEAMEGFIFEWNSCKVPSKR